MFFFVSRNEALDENRDKRVTLYFTDDGKKDTTTQNEIKNIVQRLSNSSGAFRFKEKKRK